MSRKLSKSARNGLRRLLFKRQGGVCCYCGKPVFVWGIETQAAAARRLGMTATGVMARQGTLDHLKRLCDGGSDHYDNFGLACQTCNSRRGEVNWCEFKTQMAA